MEPGIEAEQEPGNGPILSVHLPMRTNHCNALHLHVLLSNHCPCSLRKQPAQEGVIAADLADCSLEGHPQQLLLEARGVGVCQEANQLHPGGVTHSLNNKDTLATE